MQLALVLLLVVQLALVGLQVAALRVLWVAQVLNVLEEAVAEGAEGLVFHFLGSATEIEIKEI